MNVTAAICWYAEDPKSLTRTVSSLKGYCDSVVAFCGRWGGFPELPDDDPEEQADAVADACDELGISYRIALGNWETQVEKRSELMQESCMVSDWVLVIDGDEYIESGTVDFFRSGLERTEHDVARVFHHRLPIKYGRSIQRVYRSSTKVSVTVAHNGYVTQDGRFLNGDPCYVHLMPTAELAGYMVIAHDLSCREPARMKARKEYLLYRHKNRVEAWV